VAIGAFPHLAWWMFFSMSTDTRWLESLVRRAEEEVPPAPLDVTRFSFPVRVAVTAWPYVQIDVALQRDVVEADLDVIARRFMAAQDAWNTSRRRGTLYLIGHARILDCRQACFHVDLGSAGPPALGVLIEALGQVEDVASVAVTTVEQTRH
jgi:hypothetical protein